MKQMPGWGAPRKPHITPAKIYGIQFQVNVPSRQLRHLHRRPEVHLPVESPRSRRTCHPLRRGGGRVRPFDELSREDQQCVLATSTTRTANTSSPRRRPRTRGSTTSGRRSFFALVSHRRGGYCFYRDARLRRLMRYRYNNVPTDVGRPLLLHQRRRRRLDPELRCRSRPTLDAFECRHGLGYTRITGERKGVRAVAADASCRSATPPRSTSSRSRTPSRRGRRT